MTHDEVAEYNWDDGLAPVWLVVDDPATDFGTALLIYWRLEGPWFRKNSADCNREAFRLIEILEQRLISGFYRNRSIIYDPVEDNRLSHAQVYKLKQAGVPVELIEWSGQNDRRGSL